MRTSTNQAKLRAFFGSVDAASELRGRPTFHSRLPEPWLSIRPSRRERYLSGIGRPHASLIELLSAEYRGASQVRRSMVWEYLDPDTSDLACEARLFEECGLRRSSSSIEEVLESFHSLRSTHLDFGLEDVMRHVLALRVASRTSNVKAITQAGQDLAWVLLMLTGCPDRRAASREIWHLARPLLRTCKKLKLRFAPETWGFIADHAMAVTADFRLKAYAIPGRGDLPFRVVEELLRDIVTAVTTEDRDQAEFILSRFDVMSPHRGDALRSNDKCPLRLPDIDGLSIWVRH